MLNIFGKKLRFDISCQFETTLDNSNLRPYAHEANFKCLVDSSHGHAQHCLCQLSHLTTYQPGLRLENLEVCEHMFSQSNANGGIVQHMSIFHWRQAIVHYFQSTDDMETYHNLSKYTVCYLSLLF